MAVGGNELKASISLGGGKEFQKEISGINASMRQLDAESKKLTAEFDGQANSIQALTAKQENLLQALDLAQTKVQKYSDRIQQLQSEQAKIANSTEEYRNELKKLEQDQSKLEKGSGAYNDMAQSILALNAKIRAGEQSYEGYNREITKLQTAQAKAETEVIGLNREIDQNANYLREAKNSADQCATSIDKYGNSTEKAAEGTSRLGGIANSAIGNVVADIAMRAADAAAEAAKAMVEVGSNFEAAMSEVEAISGAAGSDLDQMAAKAKTLGSTTKFTATEVAEGFKYMSLAGWDTSQMLEAIDGVVNLAAASEMDLGQASDMVTDYLSAFGLAASDAGKMVDEMVYAQSHSNTSTEQLGDAFGNCAANMNAAGQSMETTTAVLEAMANQGTKGAQAGTALAAIMRDITQKMKNGAIQIGDTSVRVQDAKGNFRDLTDILADVEKATDGMGTAQKASALQSTFTARSIKAVNQVLNEGTDKVKSYKDALKESDGAAAQAAETMMDNFKGAVTEAQSAAEGLGVAVFEKVSGPLTDIVDVASDVMGAITDALTPPPKSDLEEFLDNLKSNIEETRATIESLGNVDFQVTSDIASIEQYRDVLEKATKGEELSEFEKYQLQKAVESLDGVIPGLAEAYDKEKSSIDMTTDAMKEYIKTAEQQIELRAYEGVLENASKAHAEAELEVTRATSARKEAQEQLNEAMKDLPVEMQEMIKNGADVSTVFNEMRERGVSLYEDTESAVKKYSGALDDANESLEKAKKNEEDSANILAETEGLYSKKARSLNQYSKTNNVLAKDIKDGTRAQEEQAEAMREGIPLTGDWASSIQIAGKVTEESTKLTRENTGAINDETTAVEKSGFAWMQRKSVAQSAVETNRKLAEEAAEHAQEAAERAKESAEAEKDALETTRQAYEDNYNSIKNTLSQKLSLWDAFDGGEDVTVENMLANLQSQNEGIKQYRQEMEEVIAAYGDELGPDLVNTLQSMGADAANTWHHMWITMSQDNAPQLFHDLGLQWTEGLNLADQIAKYCAGNLTAYQIATGEMGSTKIEWTGLRESVEEMTPELDAAIQAAQAAGVAIPDGLADGLASGETTTEAAVEQITSAMQGTFQGLYEIAQQSGADIPVGLEEGIDGSAESYQSAINKLTESLSQAGSEAGAAMSEEVSNELENSKSTVETAAGGTAEAAAKATENKKSEFSSAGQSSAQQYSQGISSQRAQATSAGRQLAQAAKQGTEGKESEFQSVGQNMAAALAAGIRAGQSTAINAAVNMAVEAYNRAKAAIGQHSPTGIFKDELGKNVPLAFAAGIKQYQNVAETAAAQMSRATFDSAQFIGAVNGMESQAASPTVNVDTSPIAKMIGGMPSGTQVNVYMTIDGSGDPVATGEAAAREFKQLMRMG